VALWRLLPLSVGFDAESRRWDSARRRCRARSFLRLAASETSSSAIVAPVLPRIRDAASVPLGGLELCIKC
jgi:hypothetical protein